MEKIIHIKYHKTPVGELLIGCFEEKLCICDWRYRRMRTSIDKRICHSLKAVYKATEKNEIIDQTIEQLTAYFNKNLTSFSIPLQLVGTDFQQQVWHKLSQIPYGTTNSYTQLAQKLGNTKAIRAVATANGANAISIIIPCHRIIGSNGDLVGYAGGLSAKKQLLQLEGSISKNEQMTFFS